jgi:hypothetical protein
VQGPAAVALISGKPQMIDEDGECGEREMLGQNDADAKRNSRSGQR